jgi:hypothetical protein
MEPAKRLCAEQQHSDWLPPSAMLLLRTLHANPVVRCRHLSGAASTAPDNNHAAGPQGQTGVSAGALDVLRLT